MDKIFDDENRIVSEEFGEYGTREINALTHTIIGSSMEVYNTIGRGFLESVYKDCLCLEFEKRKIKYQKEKQYNICYKGVQIPHHYFADFLVEEKIILEVKAQNSVIAENHKQIINYLAVSGCKIGLLINFGESSLKYKRFILTK
ncbi:MAG: GxxExxY protein [bacterium]|nr:GxxExxY protein [bacterium]